MLFLGVNDTDSILLILNPDINLEHTRIHLTKKLEKTIRKLVTADLHANQSKTGKWNATIFYVNRKKCWLLTNGISRYNVILIDIKASNLSRIAQIFMDTLYTQLVYDGVIVNFEELERVIGELDFFSTDNDRSMTAFQNQRLYELDWWKHDVKRLEDMPVRDLANRMNTSAIFTGKSKKITDLTDAITEMKKLLDRCGLL